MSSLLLLLSSLKFGGMLLSAGSMVLSIGVYAMLYGWPFAIGFVLLILVHELGHYVAAQLRGLRVGLPTFVPFVGAWIALKDMPVDAETEAHVAFAGPLAGTFAAFAVFLQARHLDSDVGLAIAYSGFLLNLLNLIPISPLDGGRITAIISPRIWFAGVPLLVALWFWMPSPLLILIAVLALPNLLAAWRAPTPDQRAYYDVPLRTRVEYALMYLGLAAILALMTYNVHERLSG